MIASALLSLALLVPQSDQVRTPASWRTMPVRVSVAGLTLRVSDRGRRYTVPLDSLLFAYVLDTAWVLAAARDTTRDGLLLLVDVRARSRGPQSAGGMCGAGEERALLWLRLPLVRALPPRIATYASCFYSIEAEIGISADSLWGEWEDRRHGVSRAVVFRSGRAAEGMQVSRARLESATTIPLPNGDSLPGDRYGGGYQGVILVGHGGYSQRQSWAPQARVLADSGFHVLVFETRGAVALRGGRETECLYDAACIAADVLAAVRHLRERAGNIAVVAGSAGGGGAAQASVDSMGAISKLILLAPMGIDAPDRISSRVLVITARDDRSGEGLRLPGIQAQFDRMPGPKELVVLEGSAHGQHIFGTPDGPRLMGLILRALRTP